MENDEDYEEPVKPESCYVDGFTEVDPPKEEE